MARGLRSKRERRNRAAIRDKRSAWRAENLEKILTSKDTPPMPVETSRTGEEEMAVAAAVPPSVTAAPDAGEVAMSSEGSSAAAAAAAATPYIHFTHSEKKKMKRKMRHQDQAKREKVMKKMVKSKFGSQHK